VIIVQNTFYNTINFHNLFTSGAVSSGIVVVTEAGIVVLTLGERDRGENTGDLMYGNEEIG